MFASTLVRSEGTDTLSGSADLASLRDKMLQLDRPLIWVITGDSITQGAKWLGSERSYPEVLQEHVRWTLQRRRDLFVNSGISGERGVGLLADFDWRVLQFKPDIVSVMIRMNNAVAGPDGRRAFESDLTEMIRRIRAAGAIPIVHRTNPIDVENPGSQSRADLPAYNQIIADVGQTSDVILIDHWSHWQKTKPAPAELRSWLADPLHPNGAGHRQFAIELFRVLGCYNPSMPSCQP